MNLFYVPAANIRGDDAEFPEEEAHHAMNVLRLNSGDPVHFTDGRGGMYYGKISRLSRKSVQAIIEEREIAKPGPIKHTMVIGYIRQKQRMEFAIEKLVEIGIKHIALFHGDHSEPGKMKTERIEKIIKAASKQSLQYHFPQYSLHNSLKDCLTTINTDYLLAAHERVEPEITPEIQPNLPEITGITGPEGGLSEEEAHLINQYNGRWISLGRQRLRAETAALVLATLMTK